MPSKDRVSAPSHSCPKCVKSHTSEKLAIHCCDTGTELSDGADLSGEYGCGKCAKHWADFQSASNCCKAYHVTCPTSDLPQDAFIGHGLDYSYGKSFTGQWELVCNKEPHTESVRVYQLPPLVAKMVEDIYRTRFEAGRESAQIQMRDALGIPRENPHGA